LQIYKKV